jgi:phosphoribosylaminoimidazole-succinocarboxamide synthase
MVCGIRLPEGLRESDRLPEPIFTPSTKAAQGHDQNITYDKLAELVGEEAANAMRIRSLAVYGYAHTVALEQGIIIADTKFEFGWWNEEVILIDEVLTPDSSRFWLANEYRPGGPQPSLDKQPVRDWLAAHWREGEPAPELPPDVVEATTERYLRAYRMLTGEELSL